MKQSEFGEMLGLAKSSFSRFMGSGNETTGKGSNCYATLNAFFQKQQKNEKKASDARYIAFQAQQSSAVASLKPAERAEPEKSENDAGNGVENGEDEHRQKKARLDSSE